MCLHCRSASTTPSGSPCSSQQSVYHPGGVDAPSGFAAPNTSGWNPFADDNFSKLTAEELLNKDFAKLAESMLSLNIREGNDGKLRKSHNRRNVLFFCTAAAVEEKVARSSEGVIPELSAFPGKTWFSFAHCFVYSVSQKPFPVICHVSASMWCLHSTRYTLFFFISGNF